MVNASLAAAPGLKVMVAIGGSACVNGVPLTETFTISERAVSDATDACARPGIVPLVVAVRLVPLAEQVVPLAGQLKTSPEIPVKTTEAFGTGLLLASRTRI